MFRVWCLGFEVVQFGIADFNVWDLEGGLYPRTVSESGTCLLYRPGVGFSIWCLGFRVQTSEFNVEGSGFEIQCLVCTV